MIRPPFMARVAAGLAVTVVEETRRLPSTAVTLPMTSVSAMLQTTMRVQQTMTALAIKGDQALSFLYPEEEQPAWAVFDEDISSQRGRPEKDPVDGQEARVTADTVSSSREQSSAAGRFALYSKLPPAGETADDADPRPDTATTAAPGPAGESGAAGAVEAPEIAQYLDYDVLTLAQLRARLRSLSTAELTELLEYEQATRTRAPFLTMLSNRITSASSK